MPASQDAIFAAGEEDRWFQRNKEALACFSPTEDPALAVGQVISAGAKFGYCLPAWYPREAYRPPCSARRDLGSVIPDAIHEIAYLCWLLGEVEAVACFSGKRSSPAIDTEDTGIAVYRRHPRGSSSRLPTPVSVISSRALNLVLQE
ncbi:MAG: hypothetical protein NZ578_15960 [Candidatus Binatia bacterium]|nr:hypothetical protein [Candidatus Binatia bacterium]